MLFHYLFRFTSHIFGNMCVNIDSGGYIGVAENVLNQFYIHSRFTQPCCKGMTEIVAAEIWQQHFRIFAFQIILLLRPALRNADKRKKEKNDIVNHDAYLPD